MNQEPDSSPLSAYILSFAVGVVLLVFCAAGLTAFAMSMFDIQGYFMPWNGPFDLFLKVDPMLVGWILLGISYGLLRVFRRVYPKELEPKERPWWRILP